MIIADVATDLTRPASRYCAGPKSRHRPARGADIKPSQLPAKFFALVDDAGKLLPDDAPATVANLTLDWIQRTD
jgi:hypothetical protein